VNLGEDRNQYAGEGTSRQNYVRLDNDGKYIDHNLLHVDENMNEPSDDKDLSQFKNAEGESNHDLDLKL